MDKTIIIAIISSGALSTLVSSLFNIWQTRKKKNDGVRAGMKMLLYDRIKHLGKGYIQRGYVTTDELEDLTAMHEIYHEELEGNGFLDTLMKNVKSLPIH
jgi:hypothetical protein